MKLTVIAIGLVIVAFPASAVRQSHSALDKVKRSFNFIKIFCIPKPLSKVVIVKYLPRKRKETFDRFGQINSVNQWNMVREGHKYFVVIELKPVKYLNP